MDKLPKIFAFTALGLAALPLTVSTAVAADVGVSVSVGQPGFYGRLDIGDYPAPQVVYRRPVIVEHGYSDAREPVYLRVPPGHRRHWNRNCSRYNACGQPVYFVRDDWYNNVYAPQYRERHDNGHGGRHDRNDRHDHDHDRNDRRGDHHGDHGDNGDRRDERGGGSN